jgi:hypothetical protein
MFGPALLAVVTASASLVLGQTGWLDNQTSATICQWQQLRGELLAGTTSLSS